MISASELIGLMAYDGDRFDDPFRVTAESLAAYRFAEPPDDGWVMLWAEASQDVVEEGLVLQIRH